MKSIQILILTFFSVISINAQQFSHPDYTEIFTGNNNKVDTFFTITHSLSQNINTGTSVSCNSNGVHYENSYYRVFDLVNFFNLNGDWSVQKVELGIGLAESGTGTYQPIELRLYVMPEYDLNTIILDSLHLKKKILFDVDNNESGTIKTININPAVSIPYGTVLVVEVFVPDGHNDNHKFFIGSNDGGQTDKTYIRAPQCGVENPVDVEQIGFGDMSLVMNVIGAYTSAVPEILSFQIQGQLSLTEIKNEPDYTINVVMPADTSLKTLTPEITVPLGFYISPQSGNAVDFSLGQVEYVVTNEYNKVIQSWFANVINAGPDIINAVIQSQNGETIIDDTNHQITIPVPFATDLTNVSPAITIYDGFVINPESGSSQDFSVSPVTYTVSHASLPLSQAWQISVVESEPTAIDKIDSNIKIYPNPAKDYINIYGDDIEKVEVYNIFGEYILSTQKRVINISNIASGMYLLKIKVSRNQIVKKISIIK